MRVHLNQNAVMSVHRKVLSKNRLVYILAARRPRRYAEGRSRIVYIGRTGKGVDRIARSVAFRAQRVFGKLRQRRLDVHIVSCSSRAGMRSWEYLERALLAVFRGLYHELPLENRQGKKLRWGGKLDRLFRRRAVEKVLQYFEAPY